MYIFVLLYIYWISLLNYLLLQVLHMSLFYMFLKHFYVIDLNSSRKLPESKGPFPTTK